MLVFVIFGKKKETGAIVEFLLLNKISENVWEALAGPGRKAKPGDIFIFGDDILQGEVLEVKSDGNRIVKFSCNERDFFSTLAKIGQMPLPHYISKGVKLGFVTLHVGLGTFRPVKVKNVSEHKMHSEHYEIPKNTAKLILETKNNGGRIISVGTTSCRTLESMYKKEKKITDSSGWTDIFIYPGYKFKVVDALITNFHLPESTLIMLVSAFAGYQNTMNAYHEAVAKSYRFFSFGDAMFIR